MLDPIRRACVLLVCCLVPGAGAAQEYGVIAGFGRTNWSGTATGSWGATTGLTGAALSGEWSLLQSMGARLEVGGGAWSADLGPTGLFAQDTRVRIDRVRLATLLRPSRPLGAGGARVYAEVGVGGWLETICDVDLAGGPGFFGGETESCGEWLDDDGIGPFVPRGDGVTLLGGVGVRVGSWGIGVRYERETRDPIASPTGSVRPGVLALNGQWVFSGGVRPAGVEEVDGSGPVGAAPDGADGEGGRGGWGNALLAGFLELGVPTLGYAYAGHWSDGIVPGVMRVSGPVITIVGWGEDNPGMLIGGMLVYAVGTVWGVSGAARAATRPAAATVASPAGLLVGADPEGGLHLGYQWIR